MTVEIGSTLGPYRILEQIGLGGMATVYKAYQADVDRLVALKVLPDHYARDGRFVERFKREAQIIARLEHRNIVPVYDFGEQDGSTFLVMRYLQAGTLKDILAQGALALADVARIISDIAAALDYAHAQGIIHRDVKPSNILVDKHGVAYLTDFGIAKVLEGTAELTGSIVLGTPAYMAPEQTLSKPVTPQSDVYSLGVMLYEMVTGKPPFEADTPMAVALMHVHEPLPWPRTVKPDLPETVELVILKALAKDPKERFRSAGELARAFASTSLTLSEAPTKPSAQLTQLAGLAAAGKGSEEVTYDVRLELQRQKGMESARKWLRRTPLLGGGLVSAALVGTVLWLGAQFFTGQSAVRATADAIELGHQAATLTVAAYTVTPVPTATHDPAQDLTLTAGPIQTQAAIAAQTQAIALTHTQQAQSIQETQIALTPTATQTAPPKPSATSVYTTYLVMNSGKNYFPNVVKPGRIAFGVAPCWSTEADATAATPLDPTVTVNGTALALSELPSRKFGQSPNGAGWCLAWPSIAYFVTTLSPGNYDITWQWGTQTGFGTLTVGNP